MSTVIKIENLSKYYRLGLIGGGTLREDVNRWIAALRGKPDPLLKIGESDHGNRKDGQLWALRDINLEVKEGEILGVIGRNGAGKSTLLKILSRITAPTSGSIKVKGRIGSLLEVGTGFHPELTGRENIYLNGTILGMNRNEVAKKLDEIIEFAEMGKFIDTPVKRYSSGMTVRLAFSVAAHLEPEILVIDEVLAVGDVSFQKKCLGKMGQVANQGRTVLFVSHNMETVRSLCEKGIYLDAGAISYEGVIDDCVEQYMLKNTNTQSESVINFGTDELIDYCVREIEVCDPDGRSNDLIKTWDDVIFKIKFYSPIETKAGAVTFQISTLNGTLLSFFSTQPDSGVVVNFREGENVINCKISKLPLSAGHYIVGAGLAIAKTKWVYNKTNAGIIKVHEKDVFNAGSAPVTSRYLIPMDHDWEASV